jgi:hypothetical protein
MTIRFYKIAIALLVTFTLSACSSQKVFPKFNLATSDRTELPILQDCAGKERCVVGFFAPWCKTSQHNAPVVELVEKKLRAEPRIGIVLVSGNDEPEKIWEMAPTLGKKVYVDVYGDFERTVEFSNIPTWWILDSNANILRKFTWTDVRSKDNDGAAERFINDELELAEFRRR